MFYNLVTFLDFHFFLFSHWELPQCSPIQSVNRPTFCLLLVLKGERQKVLNIYLEREREREREREIKWETNEIIIANTKRRNRKKKDLFTCIGIVTV